VRIIGALVDILDRKLNREYRTELDRTIRGLIATVLVIGLAAAAGYGVHVAAREILFGWIVELILAISLLAQRSLFVHVRRVGSALFGEGLDASRKAVGQIVGRDVRQLDEHGVARAAIESCAENFSDAVVAPCFWFAIAGFPGMLVYKAVNTMDSMIGHRTARHRAFGMIAARLDDGLNLLPARLSGFYLALAALAVPTTSLCHAMRTMLKDAGKHRSPNAGWPESAMAGALGLALAGPRRYQELVVDDPWIGDGRTQATALDVFRALSVFAVACALNALVIATIAWIDPL
jgi:adenosylcobinamide-phosphate synthase